MQDGKVRRIDLDRQGTLSEPELRAASVVDGVVVVKGAVTAAGPALVLNGVLEGRWSAECRRCLQEVRGDFEIELSEVFQEESSQEESSNVGSDGEFWPIVESWIDLEPLAREAALVNLPMAALCSEDCAGPDPDRFPTRSEESATETSAPIDPRWAALSELRFDD